VVIGIDKMMNMLTQQIMPEPEVDTTPPSSCPSCYATNLIQDPKTGEIICASCGLVITEKGVSLKQDWRAYSLAEHNERSRNGYALSNKIYDKGLSTTFHSGYDSKGKRLPIETQNKMARLKKQDERAKINESQQRNLKIALSEMSRVCNNLHLPDHIHEKAAIIYRKILSKDLVRGRSIDGFVGASIYAACRKDKIPRSISDVAEASYLSDHDVKYHYRMLLKELEFKPPVDGPMKFISSISSKLNLKGKVETETVKILSKAKKKRLVVGKNPRGVAAAVLYLACQEKGVKVTQSEIARVADTSEVTMRKRFKEYEPIMDDLTYFN